jgi:hypothetical protein
MLLRGRMQERDLSSAELKAAVHMKCSPNTQNAGFSSKDRDLGWDLIRDRRLFILRQAEFLPTTT